LVEVESARSEPTAPSSSTPAAPEHAASAQALDAARSIAIRGRRGRAYLFYKRCCAREGGAAGD
jgi:hypothetical protein